MPKPAKPTLHNEELAAKIRQNRADPEPPLVYADWLTERGSAAGELLSIAHRLVQSGDDALTTRATALKKKLDFPEEDLATVGFQWGMFEWIRLENSRDWMDGSFDALSVSRPLFASPLCAALRELRIGILRWDENDKDVPRTIEEAAKHPWARGLERLHLGDVDSDVDMAHHVVGAVGEVVSSAFPDLRWLKVHSGEQTWRRKNTFRLAGLDLPKLRELTIETCAMSKKRLAEVFASWFPKLERLALWFGSFNQGATAKAKDVEPLLQGKVFPRIVHLGLQNAEFSDDLAERLPGSKIAGRIESLDLSLGTLSDEGAKALADGAGAFRRLQRLVVDDNFLSKGALERLRASFDSCEVVSSTQKEADAEDPDFRYVTVGE